MNIELIRNQRTRWAIDGELRIAEIKICDTIENVTYHLHTGTYRVVVERCPHYRRKMPVVQITDEPMTAWCKRCRKHHIGSQHASLPCLCPQIKIGNGTANRKDGSIIIGELRLPGLILNSPKHFNRLIDRLDKAAQRGESITLTIKNNV